MTGDDGVLLKIDWPYLREMWTRPAPGLNDRASKDDIVAAVARGPLVMDRSPARRMRRRKPAPAGKPMPKPIPPTA